MKLFYLYRNGVRYTVEIIRTSKDTPMVYVESVIGPIFMGWVDRSELIAIN